MAGGFVALRRAAAAISCALAAALPAACANEHATTSFAPPPLPAAPFEDVTEEAGLPTQTGTCLVARDFDGDGLTDLVTTSVGANPRLLVHRNLGEFRFSRGVISVPLTQVLNCAAGDFDEDGWLDLVLVGQKAHERGLVRLVRNLGKGRLAYTHDPVLEALPELAWTVSSLDLDGDGRDDLAVGYHPFFNHSDPMTCSRHDELVSCVPLTPPPPTPGVVLLGREGGRFEPGPALPGDTNVNAIHALDLDQDGDQDLFLSREIGVNAYLRNDGGRLVPFDLGPPLAIVNAAMGVGFGDFDLDGHTDLYIAEIGSDQLFETGGRPGSYPNTTRARDLPRYTSTHSAWNPIAADFDLDGFDDLFVVQTIEDTHPTALYGGPITPDHPQRDLFARGGPGGFTFSAIPHRTGAREITLAAATAADFDGDGLLDVAVAMQFGESLADPSIDRTPEFRLLRNTSPKGRWLGVRPLRRDGRPATGAVVELSLGGRTVRRFHGLGSVAAAMEWEHFGLGSATRADVRVTWPGGAVTVHPGIEADRLVELRPQ